MLTLCTFFSFLSNWSTPEKIDNVELLRQMEDSIRDSLDKIRAQKVLWFAQQPLFSFHLYKSLLLGFSLSNDSRRCRICFKLHSKLVWFWNIFALTLYCIVMVSKTSMTEQRLLCIPIISSRVSPFSFCFVIGKFTPDTSAWQENLGKQQLSPLECTSQVTENSVYKCGSSYQELQS